jgi:hypothetical protein
VDLRAGLDALEKTLPGLGLRPLSCPARSQSLYRLRYPGSSYIQVHEENMEYTYTRGTRGSVVG